MAIRPCPSVYEFFAGGGLAGLGLAPDSDGPGFRTVFANDLDPAKARAFAANHPDVPLRVGDVGSLTPDDLPGRPDLCWASSPCQDLSLAGARGGLTARRSGAFWGFWRLMQGLDAQGRGPRLVVIENVVGLLTSGGGADFAAVCGAMVAAGYRVGALEMDAAHWLPQSRPRLFIVGLRDGSAPTSSGPDGPFHSPRLIAAQAGLPPAVREAWAWWRLPPPPRRNLDLAAVLEPDEAVDWLSPDQTRDLLALMAPLHRARLDAALASGDRAVAAGFRRVRTEQGRKVQRLELRFDGLAGCLRTPSGGSSRQYVIVGQDGRARARRLMGRECARLMGVPDDYRLPGSQSAALKLMGDAVAVPVVRALMQRLLAPALDA
ncbi:MAG TPA: DNA cytosine methyltransferase [Brevundimonas sp.]|uniref:DNA cytosine methyltransferase n=1 Tax=Brevundimonas sp. TaxID=1871086 RepID=UPI002633A8BC|nr:DNA cytosine methyltransferase [Brevundimonas sp.]HRO32748.1 DNA cytosine methyltransferase [Brevundimonas sp.]